VLDVCLSKLCCLLFKRNSAWFDSLVPRNQMELTTVLPQLIFKFLYHLPAYILFLIQLCFEFLFQLQSLSSLSLCILVDKVRHPCDLLLGLLHQHVIFLLHDPQSFCKPTVLLQQAVILGGEICNLAVQGGNGSLVFASTCREMGLKSFGV
jgi:hypothetical protein